MIVCSCNVLTDQAVRTACSTLEDAPRTPGQVYRCLGCSPQCGRCARTIKSILEQAIAVCPAACAACPVAHHEGAHHHEDAADESFSSEIFAISTLAAAE